MRTVEAKKNPKPIEAPLLPFGKHDLVDPNGGLAVGQVCFFCLFVFSIWKEVIIIIAALTLCFKENNSRAAVCAVQ